MKKGRLPKLSGFLSCKKPVNCQEFPLLFALPQVQSVRIIANGTCQVRPGIRSRSKLHRRRKLLRDLNRSLRKHLPEKPDEIGRPKASSVLRRLHIGDVKKIPGLRQVHIQIQSLDVHLLSRRRGKLRPASGEHIGFLKKFAVQIGNQSALGGSLRDVSIVHPEEKQNLHLRQSGPHHIAGKNPVHLLRKRPQTDLFKAGFHQLQEIRSRNLLIPEKVIQLLQKVKDRIIDLTVLHGSRRLSPLLQLLRPLLHLLSRIDGSKEVVQCLGPFQGVRSSQALKGGKLCKNPGPHRLIRIIEGGLPALSGSNSSCKAVILETIHLVLREPGQAASKIPEHGFIGIIPASDFQCSANGFRQWILQNRTVCIQIHRNSHPCSTDPDVILISRQIAADNREIPVMISLFGNQLMNLPEHLANLCRRIARKHQVNRKLCRVLPVCADRIAKQRFFQMCQGRVSRKAGRHRSSRLIPDIPVFLMRDPALPCHFADLSDGLPCQIEKILLLIGLSLHHAADRRSAVFRIIQRENHLSGVLH